MYWRKIVDILKLCNTPVSIISPIPVFAISLFLISRKDLSIHDLPILLSGVAVSLLSNFGSNLWNHCNDLKEDIAQEKKTVLTQDILMHKTALFSSLMFYASSLVLIYYLSVELKRPIYLYFTIWALVTWSYSDNIILKKLIGFRLKEHYIGELITYSIAWPTYTLSIWLIYSDLNATGIIIAAAFLFLGVSIMLLKDLKDISGDRKAGLKTFAVVFSPSQLVRFSCYFVLLYYFVIMNPFTVSTAGTGILILIVPFIYFLRNTFFHMHRKQWTLDYGDLKALKGIGESNYSSIILLGLSFFL